MLKQRNFTISWKILAHVDLDGSNTSQKTCHCVASLLLLTTVCKRLGSEETSCWSFERGMLSHSCLTYDSSCSTVLGLLCQIFCFMIGQMFSTSERSGLQAGQFSTRTLQLQSHAVVMDAVWGLALSYWNMQGLPWKRRCSDGSKCCSKTSMYFSALKVPFQMSKLPTPQALMQPHDIRDAGFWTVRW